MIFITLTRLVSKPIHKDKSVKSEIRFSYCMANNTANGVLHYEYFSPYCSEISFNLLSALGQASLKYSKYSSLVSTSTTTVVIPWFSENV